MRCFHRIVTAGARPLLVAAACAAALALSAPAAAQSQPPGRGTVALEGTMKTFYRAANVVIVTTIDGIEHVYRFAKDLVVHGGKGSGVDALEGLHEGSTVVVHYTPGDAQPVAQEIDIDEGLIVTEAVVTHIGRGRKEIVVRYDTGKTDTFQLTDRAAAEAALEPVVPGTGKIVIYYANESGRKVAHYFKKVS